MSAALGALSLPFDGWGALAAAIALYSVAVSVTARAARVAFGAAAGLIIVLGVVVPSFGIGNALFMVTALLALLYIGISIGERRRYLAALVDHAETLEREQEQRARLAVAEEREHIAREMHDVIAHGVTVMVRLADGAARELDARETGGTARQAVGHIADTGRRVLVETRRMLGALGSEDGAELHPQPTLADLPALIDEFRAAGLDVTFTTAGVPPTSESVQLTVYRAVQKCLTNVLKHGIGARTARVSVDHRDGVVISVADDGAPPRAGTSDGGRGLLGMRQRAALFGGTVTAGADASGWRTTLTLPASEEG